MLRNVAEEFGPDVVFIWNLQGLPHEMALDAEALPGVAVAYWLAGYTPAEPDSFWQYWMKPPGHRAFLEGIKRPLRRAALAQMRSEGKPVRPQMRHVAVVSNYMRGRGLAEGTLPEHARVIYNGVEVQEFFRPVVFDVEGPLRMMVAGRVSADKGVHTAVEALACLEQELGQGSVHLRIAGSGPAGYLARLKQSVQEHGLDGQVSFLGHIPREEMPNLMADCHVMLLPSTYPEAFSRAVLEGMACGLAVVGTLAGGTGELLQHEVTGLTFVAGDSSDLANQIRRLALEPGLRERLAERGQDLVVERFSLDCMVDHVEALLQEAIAQQP
jgi:glycosyltransferase involved in cell wall biosynthesis